MDMIISVKRIFDIYKPIHKYCVNLDDIKVPDRYKTLQDQSVQKFYGLLRN